MEEGYGTHALKAICDFGFGELRVERIWLEVYAPNVRHRRSSASLAAANRLALGIGALLAMAVNNLPAAAFGAVWLAGAHPPAIIAFVIGTNVAALATPHGSVATLLARAVGVRNGVATPVGEYLRSAWRYAIVGTLAGALALFLVGR